MLHPRAGQIPEGAWTDGSVGTAGGAAAWQSSSGIQRTCRVDLPCSATQCELVGLALVAHFHHPPPLVLTDSLASLHLIQTWGQRGVKAVMSCPVRDEVRLFLHHWLQHGSPPALEKVKAHNTVAIQSGDSRACGNEHADGLAKAACSHLNPVVYHRDPRFADAVRVRDSHGHWVTDIASAISAFWWTARRRTWLAQLFPTGMAIDWEPSVAIFRPPYVVNGEFVHHANPPV
jgi:hypothetical protein